MTLTFSADILGHTFTVSIDLSPSTEVDTDETPGAVSAHIWASDSSRPPWFGFTPSSPDQEPMWEE